MDIVKQPVSWQLVTSLQPVACLYSWKLNQYCQTAGQLTTCHQPAPGRLLVLLKIKSIWLNSWLVGNLSPACSWWLLRCLKIKSICEHIIVKFCFVIFFINTFHIFINSTAFNMCPKEKIKNYIMNMWLKEVTPAWKFVNFHKNTAFAISYLPGAGWWQVVTRPAVWPYPFSFQEYKQPARCGLVTSCQLAGCSTISI